jgi:hypothetical protein
MAKIYNKTGTYVDQMVILDPREALVYPFDFGNSWTEIRFGAFLSYTSLDDDNSKGDKVANIQLNAANAINNIFLGLVGWTGDVRNLYELPKLTGVGSSFSPNYVNYFGYTNAFAGGGSNVITEFFKNTESSICYFGGQVGAGAGSAKGWGMFMSTSGNTYWVRANAPVAGGMTEMSLLLPTGNQLYTGKSYTTFNMGIFKRNIPNNTFELTVPYAHTSPRNIAILETDTPTIEVGRNALARFVPIGNDSVISGYLSHNGRVSGQFYEPPPSGFLIYSPFFNFRLRVHAIVIERYS